MIQAVIFDWGGTLTPWHTVDPLECWTAATGDADLGARMCAAEDELWRRCRDEQRSATLAEVFTACELAPTDEVLTAYHRWWEPHTFLDPDVPGVFAALHAQGIRVGVLSNTIWPRHEHERIFARDGIADAIDGAVYTSEIGWTKPHPEAFRAALAAVGGADPAATVFVGDRVYDDVHGAKSAGMRAVLVPHSTIPSHQLGPVAGRPDAVVDRLADLVPLVHTWNGNGGR